MAGSISAAVASREITLEDQLKGGASTRGLTVAGEIHARFQSLMAKNYIDDLSEEVQKGLRTKASQGLCPSFAPLDYLNIGNAARKRVIVPDPVLGPVVTMLYNWFATAEYSLKALAGKAYAEGFRFRKSQGKVPVTTLHKMLRNRIYTEDLDYGGKPYEGT